MSLDVGVCLRSLLICICFCAIGEGKVDSLQCFSTYCIEYATRAGCKPCSGRVLTAASRKYWADYMKVLSSITSLNRNVYGNYIDKPICCEVNRTNTEAQFCMSLQSSVEHKYYQLSCSYSNGKEFPIYGSAFCHDSKQSEGCCQTDHCNVPTRRQIDTVKNWNIKNVTNRRSEDHQSVNEMKTIIVTISVVASIVIFILLLFLLVMWRRLAKRPRFSETVPVIPPPENWPPMTDGSTHEWEWTESGSGSGMQLLVPRTMARQIERLTRIGQGRYGEVWKGRWRDTFVAIKIFSSRDERSWFRETEMYRTVCLRHENILGFIAADNKDNGQQTQLWLITDYHPNGSLFDYLSVHSVDLRRMFRMTLSIISGLQHLHGQIFGLQGKPAIAHRDLKSRNILVKSDYTCCIADLGLAVKQEYETGSINLPDNPTRVGTNRYMAPEVLNESIMKTIDAYKQADLYSLGLIFWELVTRCDEPDEMMSPEPYALPYQDMVPPDPTVEEMTSIVCEQGIRPPISPSWEKHRSLAPLVRVMEECWHADPSVRPPALRIQKTIKRQFD